MLEVTLRDAGIEVYGGTLASRFLGSSRTATFTGPRAATHWPGIKHFEWPQTQRPQTAHPRRCSCQARATSGVPFTKRGGECPESGSASPDGLARYAGTKGGAQ